MATVRQRILKYPPKTNNKGRKTLPNQKKITGKTLPNQKTASKKSTTTKPRKRRYKPGSKYNNNYYINSQLIIFYSYRPPKDPSLLKDR